MSLISFDINNFFSSLFVFFFSFFLNTPIYTNSSIPICLLSIHPSTSIYPLSILSILLYLKPDTPSIPFFALITYTIYPLHLVRLYHLSHITPYSIFALISPSFRVAHLHLPIYIASGSGPASHFTEGVIPLFPPTTLRFEMMRTKYYDTIGPPRLRA